MGRGERVFSLLGRVPELDVAALGTLKRGAVYVAERAGRPAA